MPRNFSKVSVLTIKQLHVITYELFILNQAGNPRAPGSLKLQTVM